METHSRTNIYAKFNWNCMEVHEKSRKSALRTWICWLRHTYYDFILLLLVWIRRSCWSRRDSEWSMRSSNPPIRRRAASCTSSRMFTVHWPPFSVCFSLHFQDATKNNSVNVQFCYSFLEFHMWCIIVLLFFFRVMQDRREQARQDLKGLEETVVSSLKLSDK